MKKRYAVFVCLVLIIAAGIDLLSFWMPWKTAEDIVFAMDICSVDGETRTLTLDAALVDNGIDPVHYAGKLWLDGTRYIDHMARERLRKLDFSAISRLRTIHQRLYERHQGISYDDFYTINLQSRADRVDLTVFYDTNGNAYVRIKETKWNKIHPVVYYGPADDSESALLLQEKFYNR